MNTYITYGIIFVILLALELVYFKIADKFNIIDKPNERSSHSTIVLRGGGIIFLLGAWVWSAFAAAGMLGTDAGFEYPWFLAAVTLVAGVSFVDDIRSLPNWLRLVAQFVAMAMMFYQLGLFEGFDFAEGFSVSGVVVPTLILVTALVVCVGASDIINFMDGINGITGGYALAVLLSLALMNSREAFIEGSFLLTIALAIVVFCIFNFRPLGKAKCFAGDVGSIGIAFIMLFAIGKLVVATGDVTWLIFLLVFGADGCFTIVHRVMLHESIGKPHRKHAYQLMANELKITPPVVSCIYMAMQLAISLGFIYLCPNTVVAHWIYLVGALALLACAYVCFIKKYYYLHEEYLASLKK